MEKYRIHFEDNYGQATIGCRTQEEFDEAYKNVKADPMCDNIWVERWYEEEGWQA